MKDVEVHIGFAFFAERIAQIRKEHGTDIESEFYADGIGAIFLNIVYQMRKAGLHPEVLEAAAKKFRVDLDEVKKVLYANPGPAEGRVGDDGECPT